MSDSQKMQEMVVIGYVVGKKFAISLSIHSLLIFEDCFLKNERKALIGFVAEKNSLWQLLFHYF